MTTPEAIPLCPPIPPRRLLVVDDEAPILFALRQYFSPLGYAVVCAREREEAEALLAHDEFALVIADLREMEAQVNDFDRSSCACFSAALAWATCCRADSWRATSTW